VRGDGPGATRLVFTSAGDHAAGLRFKAELLATDLDLPLVADAGARDVDVRIGDVRSLAIGDDVDVGFTITDDFVAEHGMTGTWKAFNGQWQTFYRRRVVAIDAAASPARVTLDVPLRDAVKTRDGASLRRVQSMLSEVGVESLSVSDAQPWDAAWAATQMHAIAFEGAKDAWVKDVATFASWHGPQSGPGVGTHLASGGVLVSGSKRVTIEGSHFAFSENRGDGGNGYLVEILQSNEVLVRDTEADHGRHNFIQNWGFGTTGCVLLRVTSHDGVAMVNKDDTLNLTGLSELHHSLATANLVDSSTFDDGFSTVNRGLESSGAGHTGTMNVLWNNRGKGMLRSLQYGTGYVIGTEGLTTVLDSPLPMADGTKPVDWSEGLDGAAGLEPSSLYEDMLARRLGAK
jgi:hypothetical protein